MELAKQETKVTQAKKDTGVERTARPVRTYIPRTDIVETANEYILICDLPGVEEKSLDLSVEENVLHLHASAGAKPKEGHRLTYAEYNVGDFARTFALPEEIKREDIEATLRNGVLTLTLPKAKEARAHKIKVKTVV